MATTTPNFGWPVPTSTDLVKDGATAIEALGDSIDASLLDLKGGTTGQVLSKTTGTDMDFTWVTTDDANAIQNSIVNAKGDLIGASANDTPAILSVGANGETLVADSSASVGIRYQAPVNANPVINSAFQVWQRGTTFSTASVYTADRWYWGGGGNAISRQTTSDTTNLPNIQYCARVGRSAGNTGTGTVYFANSFESVNSIPYAGKTVTVSFYARKGADYSGSGSTVNLNLTSGTGTDENIIVGYTGGSTVNAYNAALTTTWQRFTFSGTVPTNCNELAMYFSYTPVGTAGAADYFETTGVQIEVGSVATPFKTYAGTIQGELAACQRYYWRSTGGSVYSQYAQGMAGSTTACQMFLQFPVTMRTNPTAIDFSTLQINDSITLYTVTGLSLTNPSPFSAVISPSVASGLTLYRLYQLGNNNSTSGYLGITAEL
jgi:hypothetical protein